MRNIFLFLLFIASVLTAKDLDPIYLDIPAYKYLIGDFSSSKLKYYKDAENGRVFHMRNDVFSQFQKMKKAYETYAREKKLKVKTISLRSAFRSFNDQKYIWETKFTGQKKMGKSVKGKTAEERAKLILEYSSAPGTSRHHWGTDLDLNSLSNTYFGKGGAGEELYKWLLQNAPKYGFCQPYNELKNRGNKGYFEERWHWSYAPVSNKLLKDWNEAYKEQKLNFKKHKGSEVLENKRSTYVNSINTDCAKTQEPSL